MVTMCAGHVGGVFPVGFGATVTYVGAAGAATCAAELCVFRVQQWLAAALRASGASSASSVAAMCIIVGVLLGVGLTAMQGISHPEGHWVPSSDCTVVAITCSECKPTVVDVAWGLNAAACCVPPACHDLISSACHALESSCGRRHAMYPYLQSRCEGTLTDLSMHAMIKSGRALLLHVLPQLPRTMQEFWPTCRKSMVRFNRGGVH